MKYRVVDDYPRQEHFDFYRRYRSPFYSITFSLDITRLKEFVDDRGYPVYLNLCYFFTRAAGAIEDFRYRVLDGRIVLYDELHPGLAVPAPGGLFSFAYFRSDPDVETFNREAAPVLQAAEARASLVESRHRNYLFFTAIPGVAFSSFTHAWDEATDAAPRVAFGKFQRDGARLLTSVGLQVNHLFIDGRALGELVQGVQALYDDPA